MDSRLTRATPVDITGLRRILRHIDAEESSLPGIVPEALHKIEVLPEGTCGSCGDYRDGWCEHRQVTVGARDVACPFYVRA